MRTKKNKRFSMTETEIRNVWMRRGLTDFQMVQCLADLNGVNREDMRQFLVEQGLIGKDDLRERYTRLDSYSEEEKATVINLYLQGKSWKEIAAAVGRTDKGVYGLINRLRCSGAIPSRERNASQR